jgi:hypothetical protein
MRPGKFRLRKISDIDQEHPVYEIVDEERRILLDITKTDAGVYEACIIDNEGEGRVVGLDVLLELIREAQRKIDADE